MHGAGVVLSHQGGWDEALVWLVPIGLLVGMVAVAVRSHREGPSDS